MRFILSVVLIENLLLVDAALIPCFAYMFVFFLQQYRTKTKIKQNTYNIAQTAILCIEGGGMKILYNYFKNQKVENIKVNFQFGSF